MSHRGVTVNVLVIAMAIALSMTAPAAAQAPRGPQRGSRAGVEKWTTARTPWGDPDLQGVYTNNDESGIPLERPNQFEGKRLEDVSDTELEQLRSQREEQRVAIAPNLGGITRRQ